MALKAGRIDLNEHTAEYASSMAAAMEQAFLLEWKRISPDATVPDEAHNDMRLLFVAIAQGVIRHLRDNHDAFNVRVNSGGIGGVNEIETTGELYR